MDALEALAYKSLRNIIWENDNSINFFNNFLFFPLE